MLICTVIWVMTLCSLTGGCHSYISCNDLFYNISNHSVTTQKLTVRIFTAGKPQIPHVIITYEHAQYGIIYIIWNFKIL
jgi:hypothetical protein